MASKAKPPKDDKYKLPKDDINILRDSIKSNPNSNRVLALKSIPNLLLTDKEKIDSGDYEWVTFQPQYGNPCKVLRRKEPNNYNLIK